MMPLISLQTRILNGNNIAKSGKTDLAFLFVRLTKMREYILENDHVRVTFLDYGGTITSIVKKSNGTNYVLSYLNLKDYENNPYYFGTTIGRTSGRTYPPRYKKYNGEEITLDINEGDLNLHGGCEGLHKKYWNVNHISKDIYELSYTDSDYHYEEMLLRIRYRLIENSLIIEYFGKSDEPTICNLTNHTYFNLNRDKRQGIENHWLKISPSKIQIIDEKFVPTEEYSDMTSKCYKAYNFENLKQVNEAFRLPTDLSRICAEGIDLAYVFESRNPEIILQSENKENTLKITTDRECAVVYTLNKVNERCKVRDGGVVTKYGGITFEMQERPNYLNTKDDYFIRHYHSLTKYTIE